MQVGESFIIFTEFTDLAGGCVFLSSNREGDLTDARNRLHHSRGRTKTVYAPWLSLNCLTVAALHLANLEQQFQKCPSDASTIGLNWKYSLILLKKCCFHSGPSLTRERKINTKTQSSGKQWSISNIIFSHSLVIVVVFPL